MTWMFFLPFFFFFVHSYMWFLNAKISWEKNVGYERRKHKKVSNCKKTYGPGYLLKLTFVGEISNSKRWRLGSLRNLAFHFPLSLSLSLSLLPSLSLSSFFFFIITPPCTCISIYLSIYLKHIHIYIYLPC